MTTEALIHYGPWAFPVFFAGLWLLVTTVLGVFSGWYGLMIRFPDRPEPAILKLGHQSGTIGLVGARGILTLSVCQGGFRLGMWRLFGPFCRPVFVPWSEIRVVRRNRILWKSAELKFGSPASGRLIILSHVADRLAHAAGNHWPEDGTFVPETAPQAFRRIFVEWLLITTVASLFYIIVSGVLAGQALTAEWLAVCIGFPATVFGIVSIFRFFASLAPAASRK